MPRLMGILNVTPDSFYDGGLAAEPRRALARAAALAAEGADILDVGGESTRPGAAPVGEAEELRRVLPVVRAVVKKFPRLPVSIDTRKAAVARRCLEAGAEIVNDISALRADPGMAEAVRRARARLVLMHMQGTPQTMQKRPRYRDVAAEVKDFLRERMRWARGAGIRRERIWLDPGIGFGKTPGHNLTLMTHLREFAELGAPLLVGCSRKSFIGKILGGKGKALPPGERLEGSLAAALWAWQEGASILRVHDVGATRKMLAAWLAFDSAKT